MPTYSDSSVKSHYKSDMCGSGSIQCRPSLRRPRSHLPTQLIGCCICNAIIWLSSTILILSSVVVILCCLCVVSIERRPHQDHSSVLYLQLLSNVQPSALSEIHLTLNLIISSMWLVYSRVQTPRKGRMNYRHILSILNLIYSHDHLCISSICN